MQRFSKSHNLVYIKITGEAISADEETVTHISGRIEVIDQAGRLTYKTSIQLCRKFS